MKEYTYTDRLAELRDDFAGVASIPMLLFHLYLLDVFGFVTLARRRVTFLLELDACRTLHFDGKNLWKIHLSRDTHALYSLGIVWRKRSVES